MDRLLSMAVFKRVVDAGSFAGAARHFGISPEMAGNHVRVLEAHLGVRLLNRTTRRMHLTEAGTAYHARCVQILSEIEEAKAEAGSQRAAPSGLLRITGPLTSVSCTLARPSGTTCPVTLRSAWRSSYRTGT